MLKDMRLAAAKSEISISPRSNADLYLGYMIPLDPGPMRQFTDTYAPAPSLSLEQWIVKYLSVDL
jgi:hypothetical protein